MNQNAPAPVRDGYAKLPEPVQTVITVPGRRKTVRQVRGQILGTMHARGRVHHYRVAGADGVLYLCPPAWLPETLLPAAAPSAQTEPHDFVPDTLRIIATLKSIPHEGKVS